VVTIAVGDDVRELGVGLRKEVLVVFKVRLVGVISGGRREKVRLKWRRATSDVGVNGESIDNADKVLDIEIGFTVGLCQGILVVHTAIDQSKIGVVLRRQVKSLLEESKVRV
jgi:hypothetical protein